MVLMKTLFIVSSFLFLVIGVAHSREIIIKDCYGVSQYGKNEFDTKRYTQDYYKVDPKNKIITHVWSYTDSAFEEMKKSFPNFKKNNIVNYNLEFLDNNFAKGRYYNPSGNWGTEITIDLKKNYVEKQINLSRPNTSTEQCRK